MSTVRNTTEMAGGIAMLIMLIIGLGAWLGSVADGAAAVLSPCATEDSDNCYWDADMQGNGLGRSFTVINGEVTYKGE